MVAAFAANQKNLENNTPYRARIATLKSVSKIQFPVESVMLKTHWISDERLKKLLADGTIPSKDNNGRRRLAQLPPEGIANGVHGFGRPRHHLRIDAC